MQKYDALVVGAGLAGSAAAWSLAQRGLRLIVLEQHAEAAAEASGNPAGIFMPVLESRSSVRESFYNDAYGLLNTRLEAAGEQVLHQRCGVLHLPRDDKQRQRFEHISLRTDLPPGLVQAVTAQEAESLSGVPIGQDALYYPDAGWLSPPSLCGYYLAHSSITLHLKAQVCDLKHVDGNWHALNAQGVAIARARFAIIAGGPGSAGLTHGAWLPWHSVRGQITRLRLSSLHGLGCVICHQGYLLPMQEQEWIIGATYTRDREGYEPHDDEHLENLDTLRQHLPELAKQMRIEPGYQGRVGYRAYVPGRLPVAGRLVPAQRLRYKKSATHFQDLAITTAHASRGIITSGLAGELVAAALLDESSDYARYAGMLSPARFLRHV